MLAEFQKIETVKFGDLPGGASFQHGDTLYLKFSRGIYDGNDYWDDGPAYNAIDVCDGNPVCFKSETPVILKLTKLVEYTP